MQFLGKNFHQFSFEIFIIMLHKEKYREEGFLYDSIENYNSFIDITKYKQIKDLLDNFDIKKLSKYDYWYKFKDYSFQEEISYEKFSRNIPDEKIVEYVYAKSHEYMLKKIDEEKFYPTWVFGTSKNPEIYKLIMDEIFIEFQKKFVKHYYPEKNYNKFIMDNRLQFYDKGCEIKIHDDGKPEGRICVFLYFLNNDWLEKNGGNLIIYDKKNYPIKIKPTFPHFVVLDMESNLFHEVEKVNLGLKYNIVSFYGGEF